MSSKSLEKSENIYKTDKYVNNTNYIVCKVFANKIK